MHTFEQIMLTKKLTSKKTRYLKNIPIQTKNPTLIEGGAVLPPYRRSRFSTLRINPTNSLALAVACSLPVL
jgi:hypothetical protein